MMINRYIAGAFVILYIFLVWLVFTNQNMLAMEIMAIGMLAEAVLCFIALGNKKK